MKRIIVALLLVAFTAGAAQAQVGVYRSGGAIKKEKKEHREKREREERERLERELYEHQEHERQEQLMKEKKEQERLAKEESERKKLEKEEQERIEKEREAERKRLAKEEEAERKRLAKKEEEERKRIEKEEEAKRKQLAKEESERKRQERREYRRNMEWTNSIVLNYSFTFLGNTHNVGLTYARCKIGGFYLNAMSGLEWNTANVDGTTNDYFVTNKKSHPRLSFTVGGVVRVAKPVFAYAGVGYAYRGLNYKTADDNWVRYRRGEYNLGSCADLEAGLIGNIKGFTLQLGYSILLSESGRANEIKVGFGYSFGSKKQKQKQKQQEMEVIEDE